MSRDHIADLLNRYQAGKTSAEENTLIENWLEANGHISSSWADMESAEKDQWLSLLYTRISDADRQPAIVKLKPAQRFTWKITVAAAVLVAAFVLYAQWPAVLSYRNRQQQVHVYTQAGKKLVLLPDGSRVWLNSGSELTYPKDFNGRIREVYLSGEAYFDVRHEAKRTFLIHNRSFTTTVLGTAFNIKEDQDQKTVEVTVTRGKVSVANEGKTLALLTPNQQVRFSFSKGTVNRQGVDAESVIAWQQADLHFDDVSFGDAVAQLSAHFGVKISFKNEQLKNCRFTGPNLGKQQLEEILKVMCAFNGAFYQVQPDGSLIIDGNGCN